MNTPTHRQDPAYEDNRRGFTITAAIGIVLLIVAAFTIVGIVRATTARADVYPTRTSSELFSYGANGNITTWLKISHRKQDDGTGTVIEAAVVDTVAYCSLLNETGHKYVGMTMTIRNYATGVVLGQYLWGTEDTCRVVKDTEFRGQDEGPVEVLLTVVACVRGISGYQSGNDQQLSVRWKVGGGDSAVLGKSRFTNNQAAC